MQPFVRVLATSLEITMSYLMVIMVMLTTTMIIMMLMTMTMMMIMMIMVIMMITVMMMMIASVGPTDGGLKAKAGYDANFSSTLIHILCS